MQNDNNSLNKRKNYCFLSKQLKPNNLVIQNIYRDFHFVRCLINQKQKYDIFCMNTNKYVYKLH